MNIRIFPISESALTVDFGNEISLELNDKVLALAAFIEEHKFCGFVELVPAYSSLSIFYNLVAVKRHFAEFPTAFSAVKSYLENALEKVETFYKRESHLIKIPVCYSEKYAPDLDFVAQKAGLSQAEVINIHCEKTYRVFMIGFLPAFAYLGEVDERIAAPRKLSPRTNVKKGSVGIAGRQTGIYPLDSPGGWQIIGQTNLEMFQPKCERISLLQTGDLVEFYSITEQAA